jgi:hypothetical protein
LPGLARPRQGSMLAAAPVHGQVALAVVLDPGVPLGIRTHGGIPRDPDLHHWFRLKPHLAMAWCHRHRRAALAKPGQVN